MIFYRVAIRNKNYQSYMEVSKMLCKHIQQQGAPEVEIDTFSGDPYFMELFKEIIEKKIEDTRRRLTILIKYSDEEVKVLAKHCIQQPPSEEYAMQLNY